ncbi:MAG: nicotinate (nicotinamide) nucleotide adenylyltransferase [Oscillospiraceae bacterium]
MKIGVYGGTFNPPHLGHLTAARAVFNLLELDKLLLIPANLPPHKDLPEESATAAQRFEMTRLAGEHLGLGDRVETLDIELLRTGKSYTSDTLEELHQHYPEAELWLLMGTDMFLTFEEWHEPARILELAGLAAFGRTEDPTTELLSAQRETLQRRYPHAKLVTLTNPEVIETSSTDLRDSLASGQGQSTLPLPVYGYILREGLYGTAADLKQLSLDELRPIALSYLKHKRIPHVLGTEREAMRLAERYGAEVEAARRAALLHDCTKKLSLDEQLTLCQRLGVVPDEVERVTLKLLHAKTGAALARQVFGVDDAVYNAILWHTTGRPDMTTLEKVLYLADFIEPNRDFDGVEDLRAACRESLDAGMRMGLAMTIEEMAGEGHIVHQNTIRALDFLKG